MPDVSEQFEGPTWVGPSPEYVAEVRDLESQNQILPGSLRQVFAYRTACQRALLALNFVQNRFAHDRRKQANSGGR
jgi:hypothetical protein